VRCFIIMPSSCVSSMDIIFIWEHKLCIENGHSLAAICSVLHCYRSRTQEIEQQSICIYSDYVYELMALMKLDAPPVKLVSPITQVCFVAVCRTSLCVDSTFEIQHTHGAYKCEYEYCKLCKFYTAYCMNVGVGHTYISSV
jgi:hypothetical protein